MIVGKKDKFAIEFNFQEYDSRESIRGIGNFLIHINQQIYGVQDEDATALACSFDVVGKRIKLRGMHVAPKIQNENAGDIASAYMHAVYAINKDGRDYWGLGESRFRDILNGNNILWALEGDEAFDDGSHVLQFDMDEKVRIIGFKSCEVIGEYDEATLTELWLSSDEYYRILEDWLKKFEDEWNSNRSNIK